MGRSPCCSKEGLNRGAWHATEDKILTDYIKAHGEGRWRSLPKKAGLKRCGKSCRLRWLNYLRPDIKRGNISQDEEELIIRLHKLLGNRWSLIAGRLPGRTDNEIKNYWNTILSKKVHHRTSSTASASPADPNNPTQPGEMSNKDHYLGTPEPQKVEPSNHNLANSVDSVELSTTLEKLEEDTPWELDILPHDLQSWEKLLDSGWAFLEDFLAE
ncbi:hypothetical protein NMG60_11022042 [Bertholletia excelsa]